MALKNIQPVDPHTQQPIHITEDDTVLLLRRIVKLLESGAVVDSGNRQRVAVDSISGTSLGSPGYGCSAGPSGSASAAASVGINNSYLYYQPVWVGPVDQRWEMIDRARVTYNIGIRQNLTFS